MRPPDLSILPPSVLHIDQREVVDHEQVEDREEGLREVRQAHDQELVAKAVSGQRRESGSAEFSQLLALVYVHQKHIGCVPNCYGGTKAKGHHLGQRSLPHVRKEILLLLRDARWGGMTAHVRYLVKFGAFLAMTTFLSSFGKVRLLAMAVTPMFDLPPVHLPCTDHAFCRKMDGTESGRDQDVSKCETVGLCLRRVEIFMYAI